MAIVKLELVFISPLNFLMRSVSISTGALLVVTGLGLRGAGDTEDAVDSEDVEKGKLGDGDEIDEADVAANDVSLSVCVSCFV